MTDQHTLNYNYRLSLSLSSLPRVSQRVPESKPLRVSGCALTTFTPSHSCILIFVHYLQAYVQVASQYNIESNEDVAESLDFIVSVCEIPTSS
jgi:hypothetical protein